MNLRAILMASATVLILDSAGHAQSAAADERIRVISLMNGRRFLYEVVKQYANEP